jgi:hypothetical protein
LRVASGLVLVEQAWPTGLPEEIWETRILSDGSEHRVFKRYFTATSLSAEVGGEVLLDTPSLIAVRVGV